MSIKEQLAGLVEKWREFAKDAEIKSDRPYQDDATTNWHQGRDEAFTDCADDLAAILATLPEPGVVYQYRSVGGWYDVDEEGLAEAARLGFKTRTLYTAANPAPAAPAGEAVDQGIDVLRRRQAALVAALEKRKAHAPHACSVAAGASR